jgi:hypothetical protein
VSPLVSNPEFDYLGVYVPVSEYMNYFNGKWPRAVVEQTLERTISNSSTEDLLRGFGSLRTEIEGDLKCVTVLNEYCSTLDVEHKLLLVGITNSSFPKKVLYTPQLVAQACNYLLTHCPTSEISKTGNPDRTNALFICHLIGELNTSDEVRNGEIRYGTKEFDTLALNFLANHFFHAEDDRMNVIARTRKLWKSQNTRARESLAHFTPEDIFKGVIGVSVDIRIAAALLLVGSVGRGSNPTAQIRTRHEKWGDHLSKFIEKISWPVGIPAADIADPLSEWDMSNFVERPCIALRDSEVVIPSTTLLVDRVTTGLVDEVEREMKVLGMSGNLSSAWGHVIEEYVRDRLSILLVKGGVREVLEEEFKNLYIDTRKNLPDLILDFGDDVFIFEVMKNGLSTSSIYSQNAVLFRQEIEDRLFKKMRQLANVISVINDDPDRLFPDGRQRNFVPIIVSGDRWGHNPIIATYISEYNRLENLFDLNNTTLPICLDIGEVELCEALIEQDFDLRHLVRSWIGSELSRMPFKNYFLKNYTASKFRLRSTSLEKEFAQSLDEIFREFGWMTPNT